MTVTKVIVFLVYRYGSIFKTHILGCPCVMISSPEAAKFVLVTRAHLFKPTFPASKERMIGKQAIFFHQGDYHIKLRKLVLRAFLPEAIKNIIPDIECIAKDSLQSWQGRLINTYQEMKTVSSQISKQNKNRAKTESSVSFPCFSPFWDLQKLNLSFFCFCAVYFQCCTALHIWKRRSAIQRRSEKVLLHSRKGLQFNANQSSRNTLPQINESQKRIGSNCGKNHLNKKTNEA